MLLCELLSTSGEPAYEHACQQCIFVGNDHARDGEPMVNQVDMYIHPGSKDFTLLRRYSSEPSNYASQSYPGPLSPRYRAVLDAARRLGIIPGGMMTETAAQIDTPEFRAWFGGSKIVDASGKPLVVYHGTKSEIDMFDRKRAGISDPGLVGKAFYFTPTREQAGAFADSAHYGKGDRPNVVAVYLSVQRPLVIRDGHLPDGRSLTDLHPQGITKQSSAAIRREIRRKHDGVVFLTDGELVQVAVFEPTQIKSAIGNRGTFAAHDPRIIE